MKILNFVNFYFFLWIVFPVIYYCLSSTKLVTASLVVFSCYGIYYAFYAFSRYLLPSYFKGLAILVTLLSIYGLKLFLSGDVVYWNAFNEVVENYKYILWMLTSLLSVFPIYVFMCERKIDENFFKKVWILCLCVGIFAFFYRYQRYLLLAQMTGSLREEFTNTTAYILLSIFPAIGLFKKKIVFHLLFLVAFIVLFILSMKRGVILLGFLSIVVYVFSQFGFSSLKKKILVFMGSAILFFGIYSFFVYEMDNSAYLTMRVEQTKEGNSSGRDKYSKKLLNYYFNEANAKEFVIGRGAQGTLSVNISYAHNDWIAILVEQGLLGFLIYGLYWLGFAKSCLDSKKNLEASCAIKMLFLIGLGKTFFSMYYLPISVDMIVSSGYYAIVLGFYLSKAFPQSYYLIVNGPSNEQITNRISIN